MPLGLQFADDAVLVRGRDVGVDFVDADGIGDRAGRPLGIAGQHHYADIRGMKRIDRRLGAGLDRIGDTDQAGRSAIDRDEHHRLAFAAALLGGGDQRFARRAKAGHQSFIADRDCAARDFRRHALAGDRLEIARGWQIERAVIGSLDDCGGERMLARHFARGDPCEQFVFV